MKKLTMFVVALFAITASTFAQEKGQLQFGLDGTLFSSEKGKWDGAKSISAITPSAAVRYFVADKIGVDVGLGLNKEDAVDESTGGKVKGDMGINLMLGGRYYYWSQDKMRLNGGLDILLGFGKGNEAKDDKGKKVSMPMSLRIAPAEFEYWPMEGGAISAELFYDMNGLNLGDNGSAGFGVDLGIKIRLQ